MTPEQRARDILGLNEPEPRRLSMRIENLWRAEGFAPVVPFNGSIFATLGRDVDPDILRESLVRVLERHQVLHSRLALEDDRAILVPEPVKAPELAIIDVPRATIAAHREGGPASPLSDFVDAPVRLTGESGFRSRL
ncbi:MAG TPA: hypothetical protein VG501_00345, partial [Rhizomicrobium sp.]|nr:hypothetical protein [Rhizomicrobium sp.]